MVTLLAFGILAAQENLSKAEKKALRKEEKISHYNKLTEFLVHQSFVVEGNIFVDRYGRRAFANQSTNFLILEEEQGTIQLALNNGFGYNGLGGITLSGKLTSFDIKRRAPDQPISIQGRLVGTGLGVIDFFLDIDVDERVTARFSSQYGHRFQLIGNLFSLEETIPYIGIKSL